MSEIDFVEKRIISAVRGLLAGRVNELLGEFKYQIPLIEFSDYRGSTSIVPVISLTSCERSEKERIIRQDAYSLTITFSLPDNPESELYCYTFAGVVNRTVFDNPTLNGNVDRTVITGKKYLPPKKPNCGMEWELIITLRITVEEIKI